MQHRCNNRHRRSQYRESLVAMARQWRQRISRSIGPLSFHISPAVSPLDFGRTCERVRRALPGTMYDSFHGSLAKTAAFVWSHFAERTGRESAKECHPLGELSESPTNVLVSSQSQLYPGVRCVRTIYTPYYLARGFGRVT